MGRGTWLREGVDPLPPAPGDKNLDEAAIYLAGDEALFKGKRVLDLGPCYGVEAVRYAHRAAVYVAYDIDELVIEWVRRRTDMAIGVVGDFRQLPFLGNSFDTVLDLGSFDNVSGDGNEVVHAYREAVRVLTPGGIFISCYANAAGLGIAPPPGETYWAPQVVPNMLAEMGMRILHRGAEQHARAFVVAQRA